jgi:uncharacterized protein (TIGR02453 family)
MIQQSTLDFLSTLKANNNREWFQTNKAVYEKAHQNTIAFADSLLEKMRIHDSIETASGKASLFRIYADTRFSKDKAPYKTHFGIRFSRATAQLRGGYYFHLEPGNSFMAGGFFSPNPDDLKRIREDIDFNYEDWNGILSQPSFMETFGELRGDGVKTTPKGLDKDHPAIELLRKKQFILIHDFTDKELLQPDFVEKLDQTFQELRPFFDYMSEVLTTDANGETIL